VSQAHLHVNPHRHCKADGPRTLSVYRAGRAVADATAEEKRLQGSMEVRFGVSIGFLGSFRRGKIAKTLDGIGLVETRGFEPLTPYRLIPAAVVYSLPEMKSASMSESAHRSPPETPASQGQSI